MFPHLAAEGRVSRMKGRFIRQAAVSVSLATLIIAGAEISNAQGRRGRGEERSQANQAEREQRQQERQARREQQQQSQSTDQNATRRGPERAQQQQQWEQRRAEQQRQSQEREQRWQQQRQEQMRQSQEREQRWQQQRQQVEQQRQSQEREQRWQQQRQEQIAISEREHAGNSSGSRLSSNAASNRSNRASGKASRTNNVVGLKSSNDSSSCVSNSQIVMGSSDGSRAIGDAIKITTAIVVIGIAITTTRNGDVDSGSRNLNAELTVTARRFSDDKILPTNVNEYWSSNVVVRSCDISSFTWNGCAATN